jgi:hypothetical protein
MAGEFTARVRWRLLSDPRWEVETEHDGHGCAEDAALFANGLGPRALDGVELVGRELAARLADGTLQTCAVTSVWWLPFEPADRLDLVDDDSFVAGDMSEFVAAVAASPTRLDPLRYCVFCGSAAIDVKVAIADDGSVEVTVFEEPSEDDVALVLLSA